MDEINIPIPLFENNEVGDLASFFTKMTRMLEELEPTFEPPEVYYLPWDRLPDGRLAIELIKEMEEDAN